MKFQKSTLIFSLYILQFMASCADQVITDGNVVLNGTVYVPHATIFSRGVVPALPATDAEGAIFCEWNGYNGNDESLTFRHGALKFQTRTTPGSSVNYTTAMLLDRSGRMGLGTVSPTTRLHLSNNSIITLGENANSTQANGISLWRGTGDAQYSYEKAGIWYKTSGVEGNETLNIYGRSVAFITGSANTAMTLTGSNGNVGIGIGAPTARLHIKGNASYNAMIKLENEAITPAWWSVYCVRDSSGTPYAGRFVVENAESKGFYLEPSGQMTIKSNTAIIGTLSAQEVKVTVTGFPDYVFQPKYKLRSLEEVESHIRTHHHLPGMPSAAEVEREGLLLSDISKKQLEKIEEITLYLIQMRKELNLLKQENVELRDRLRIKQQD